MTLALEPQLAIDAPTGLGQMMAGSGKTARHANDYYPTPAEATRALLRAEAGALDRRRGCDPAFWEPCGRGGAIARVALAEFGLPSIATDIVADPANGVDQLDLLKAATACAPYVVTNMPFALARRMIVHLWASLRVDYMALLFKASFLNCEASARLWRAGLAPTRRWDMTWRLDFTGGGASTMDTCWLVWDRIDPVQRIGLLDRDGPVLVDRPMI